MESGLKSRKTRTSGEGGFVFSPGGPRWPQRRSDGPDGARWPQMAPDGSGFVESGLKSRKTRTSGEGGFVFSLGCGDLDFGLKFSVGPEVLKVSQNTCHRTTELN